MAVYTGVLLVAVLVASGGVAGQRLTFSPSTIVEGTTSTLTVRCDVSATSTLYVIKILKGTSTVSLAIGDSRGMRVDSSIQQRATATASLDPPGSAYLALTFNAAVSCSDAGDYRCEYAQQVPTGPGAINKTLSATTNPGTIEMFVRPRLPTYSVNTSMEMECAGEVGFPVVGSWRWETRDVNFASSWTPIRPGIQQTDDPNTGTGCRRTGGSTLRFPVQQEDDNLMYRCSFRSDQYSANFTFQVPELTSPSAETTSSAVSTGTSQSPAAPDMTSSSEPCSCPGAADTQGQATTQGLSTGSAVALAVVLTFLLTLGGTLALVFLVLHHRHQPGAAGGQEGNYCDLDLASREPPRSDVTYNELDVDQNLPSVPGNRPSRP